MFTFFGITVNFITQKSDSKHLREQEKILLHIFPALLQDPPAQHMYQIPFKNVLVSSTPNGSLFGGK